MGGHVPNSNVTSILSFKPGHDGSIAYIKDGKLEFSYEAEKDSHGRYSQLNASTIFDAFQYIDDIPDVVAISGWAKTLEFDGLADIGSGYAGIDLPHMQSQKMNFMGRQIDMFSSSHERSHLMGTYAMSPFAQGEPCYALIWEGRFGDFYEIDPSLKIKKLGTVMNQPGVKYGFLYHLASEGSAKISNSYSGKVMALAGFSNRGELNEIEKKTADFILNNTVYDGLEDYMEWSPFYNAGVEDADFKEFCGKFSDLIFNEFLAFAQKNCKKGYPLLISGGCGLNCEWNSKWKNSGLFSDIFVAPVTNDTGSAIGTAVDALYHHTGVAKVSWDVYCGQDFKKHVDNYSGVKFDRHDFDAKSVAKLLKDGKIFGLIHGKCEIGPRALGNRSIIAAPFTLESKRRINAIKKREDYRPVAPVCLEEDVAKFFDWDQSSPYMLYFQKVISPKLKAITHVDDTARVQTVTQTSNAHLYNILNAFKYETGFGVLCNTSLNFLGVGFINSLHDIKHFVGTTDLDGFITDDSIYLKQL
ncbi:3-hydroxymethylcephem carbamoyltransferase [Fulvivirga sp. 29W222]|uniref:3-hydroxymethylcephem carbamoyltransferase n=1 Tax=Fulvivirga marina TaxID=2494733 RepID=A0A937KAN5_9BACT|nr:carbamoyltransferase C-terminal domain-containing protein [Fulvivirga marina]MBL6445756.1 3-hydroxymethylcephem carbamoyltransferase [Fulvivirga marina]